MKYKNKIVREHSLKCMYTNVRSIMNKGKIEEIRLEVLNNKIDILGISESWMHEGIGDAEISITGFTVFRRDRDVGFTGKQRGGGVLMYVRDKLAAIDVSDQTKGVNESIWVSVRGIKSKEVIVGVCYCSPSADKEEENNLLEEIELFSKKKATLVMGDFNHADIDWDSLQASSSGGKKFLDTINDLFLTQHVQGKTRGDSILDLVLSTEKDMVEDLLISNPISNSDHSVLLWNLECETVMEDCMIKQFNYHKGNHDKIISELMEIDWDREFMGKGAEEMWEIFLRITLGCRDKYIPMRERSEKGNKVWMKPKIMKMIKKRNKKWKKFSESPSFETKSGYIALRNKVTTEIRRAKEEQEKKIAEKIKVDPKSFYAYIRNNSQTNVCVERFGV